MAMVGNTQHQANVGRQPMQDMWRETRFARSPQKLSTQELVQLAASCTSGGDSGMAGKWERFRASPRVAASGVVRIS